LPDPLLDIVIELEDVETDSTEPSAGGVLSSIVKEVKEESPMSSIFKLKEPPPVIVPDWDENISSLKTLLEFVITAPSVPLEMYNP